MHVWGDDWFKEHGHNFYRAIDEVREICRTVRIGCNFKEKYGSLRENTFFWDGGFHSLIWPGHYSIRNKFIAYRFDPVLSFVTKYTGIHFIGLQIQKTTYNYAFQSVCKRYPKLIDELVSDLDHYELVKPGIFGDVCGTTIHKKYWKTYGEE